MLTRHILIKRTFPEDVKIRLDLEWMKARSSKARSLKQGLKMNILGLSKMGGKYTGK